MTTHSQKTVKVAIEKAVMISGDRDPWNSRVGSGASMINLMILHGLCPVPTEFLKANAGRGACERHIATLLGKGLIHKVPAGYKATRKGRRLAKGARRKPRQGIGLGGLSPGPVRDDTRSAPAPADGTGQPAGPAGRRS
jgi:hypothetical protein